MQRLRLTLAKTPLGLSFSPRANSAFWAKGRVSKRGKRRFLASFNYGRIAEAISASLNLPKLELPKEGKEEGSFSKGALPAKGPSIKYIRSKRTGAGGPIADLVREFVRMYVAWLKGSSKVVECCMQGKAEMASNSRQNSPNLGPTFYPSPMYIRPKP